MYLTLGTMNRFGLSLLFLFLLLACPPLWAWDLHLGLSRSKPALGAGTQTYESNSGTVVNQPVAKETILGDGAILGVKIEEWTILYATSAWDFKSDFTPKGAKQAGSADYQITETRFGATWGLERELAGFYVGGGADRFEEQLTYQNEAYLFSTTTPYFNLGLDLIFGMVRIRADQTHFNAGEHYIRLNSVSCLLDF